MIWNIIFLEIWRFEKHIALSEKKPPLKHVQIDWLFYISNSMNFNIEFQTLTIIYLFSHNSYNYRIFPEKPHTKRQNWFNSVLSNSSRIVENQAKISEHYKLKLIFRFDKYIYFLGFVFMLSKIPCDLRQFPMKCYHELDLKGVKMEVLEV